MKKSIKVILIIIGIIIGIILIDTLQARILKNSPFISWKEELSDDDSWVDRGIIIDTFYCTEEKDIVTVSWKLKGSKFTCPIDNINIDELNTINNKIIEYFSSDNVEYNNFSFNYIDEENNVIVVGLIDNSKEEQEKFKEEVIDSELIKFVQGTTNTITDQSATKNEKTEETTTTQKTENTNTNSSNNNSNNNKTNNNSSSQTTTKEIVINNYTGQNYQSVKEYLENQGLSVIVETTASSNPENTIVSQSINPGRYTITIKDNKIIDGITTITLKIPEVIVVYPDFTNGKYTLDDVKKFVDSNGLILKITTEESELPSGTIISQSKTPGAKVIEGTTLKITVAE